MQFACLPNRQLDVLKQLRDVFTDADAKMLVTAEILY